MATQTMSDAISSDSKTKRWLNDSAASKKQFKNELMINTKNELIFFARVPLLNQTTLCC